MSRVPCVQCVQCTYITLHYITTSGRQSVFWRGEVTQITQITQITQVAMEAPTRATTRAALPDACLTRRGGEFDFQLADGSQAVVINGTVHRPHDTTTVEAIDANDATHCYHCTRRFAAEPAGEEVPEEGAREEGDEEEEEGEVSVGKKARGGCRHTVPIAFDAFSQEFLCKGRFCSPSCAKAFALQMGGVAHALFMKWAAKTYGNVHIPAAPPRDALRRFGGPLSDEDFDVAIAEGKMCGVNEVPFVQAFTTASTTPTADTLRDLKRPDDPVELSQSSRSSLTTLYEEFLAGR